MEIALFLIVLILLIVLLTRIGELKKMLWDLQDGLKRTNDNVITAGKRIDALLERTSQPGYAPETPVTPAPQQAITPVQPEAPPVAPPPIPETAVPVFTIVETPPAVPEPAITEPVHEEEPAIAAITQDEITTPSITGTVTPPVQPATPSVYLEHESWFDKWLARNPDLEKFIGENLINKIGIAILVLGIAFFVKYAIDQNWISEVGRVCIGLLCGGLLAGLAHKLRNNYRPFSSVLAGGGITVFYFTIAFAFHQYELFSQQVAFVIMVVITIFAILLSILYDRIELGILATLGGFITPFLVSKGDGNYVVLFTYLLILNGGLIGLANYKQWRILNFIAFVFTVLIYGGWISRMEIIPASPYLNTFLFGTAFYLMFIAMNLVYHVRRSGKLKAFDAGMLFSINLGYYGAGYYLLHYGHMQDYTGLFTAAMGVFNLVLSYVLYKKEKIDRNFIYLLIGLTLSFISLAAPVQLSGHYITLFWAAEMVVLFWLYQRSGIMLIKIASGIITLLVLGSLLMDWSQAYNTSGLTVLFNKGFITSIYVVGAFLFMGYLLGKQEGEDSLLHLPYRQIRKAYYAMSIVLLFITGLLEINFQFATRYPHAALQCIYLELYVIVFMIALFAVLSYRKVQMGIMPRMLAPVLLLVMYLVNMVNIYGIEKDVLATGKLQAHFAVHWLSLILLLLVIRNMVQYVRNTPAAASIAQPFTWGITLALILLFSVEIQHLYIWASYSSPASVSHAEEVFSKAGLSILWGISSFIIIWMGLHFRYKPLRIIALGLFGITVLKLFVYDLQNISQGGKIAAFILLGAILLTVSFMYQRLKKIIIDDKPTNHEENQ